MKIILKIFIILIIFIWNSFANFDIKMSDTISPFFSEQKEIRHYSNIPFYQLDLYKENKLVDFKQLNDSKEKFKEYILLLKENWYNSISLDDINHLLLFEKSWIYNNSEVQKRNKIYLEYYKELINVAKNNNIDVFLTTDMQFYTDLLEKYVWNLSVTNNKLLEINKEAFEEIFKNLPWISGIILRIWEWWSAYNSWEYKSKVIYKTPWDVNYLLKQLIPIFEKNNKILIFRTWTIWIWKIWDLIYNKKTYDETFNWIKSKNIILSIKHTPWDFFWFENFNPTIWYWNLKQIVEIQIRKEYEWWWDFPNYMWDYYKKLIEKIKSKKNVIWVWNWNQTWWWWWGKNILFNFWFNFWNEINFYSVWEILKTWNTNLKEILNKYDFNKEEINILYEILKNSREVIKKWWYINDYRKNEIKIWWVFLPPLNRIWWDNLTSSPIILSIIYNTIENKINTIEESSYILWMQKQEIDLWKNNARNNELNNKIYESLINRYKIFEILHIFKKSFINYFQTWNKKYYEEIDKKINEYKIFLENKPYFHFNFDEIYKYFSVKVSIFFIILNLLLFSWLILVLIKKYKNLKLLCKEKKKNEFLISISIIFTILIILITPIFFLSMYNFYWIIVKISFIILPIIILYFLLINKLLSKIYKIKIKLKSNFLKILYSLLPILIFLEIIIFLSLIFWEQFFWNFISLWILDFNIRIIMILFFVIYFFILIYYSFYFSNISKYLFDITNKKFVYLLTIIFLYIFLVIIYNIDYKKIFITSISNRILPEYFHNAWTWVKEYF